MKYPRITSWSIVIGTWALMVVGFNYMKNSEIEKAKHHEVVNTAEDMIEWITEDVASGYVDSTYADTYIDNLEGIIINLGVTR
tara:strand:+ start:133 stop:381 length:249 start_codon:yes stop_codon:yes gene_type:complete